MKQGKTPKFKNVRVTYQTWAAAKAESARTGVNLCFLLSKAVDAYLLSIQKSQSEAA